MTALVTIKKTTQPLHWDSVWRRAHHLCAAGCYTTKGVVILKINNLESQYQVCNATIQKSLLSSRLETDCCHFRHSNFLQDPLSPINLHSCSKWEKVTCFSKVCLHLLSQAPWSASGVTGADGHLQIGLAGKITNKLPSIICPVS